MYIYFNTEFLSGQLDCLENQVAAYDFEWMTWFTIIGRVNKVYYCFDIIRNNYYDNRKLYRGYSYDIN